MTEKTVQKRALKFLESYYNNRWFKRRIYAAQEVRTKAIFGGKRADGLLAFQGWWTGKPYVVSMEAKSIKTLPAIKPYHDRGRWWRNCLRFSLFICLASGLFYFIGQSNNRADVLVPLLWCAFAGLFYGLLTWNSYRHQTIDVIYQLKQYPANEQWLAFSHDSFAALSVEKQTILKDICYYRGIGLLLVGKKEAIELVNKPRRNWYWQWDVRRNWQWISDYLMYYSKEKEIRQLI
ncbi:MAG: hypothetical protein AAF960_08775 [Bacteroidota bacterium]